MSRVYDFIVYNLSSFTGRFVLKNVIETNKIESTKWKTAVAGRNIEKLKSTLEILSKEMQRNMDDIEIIVADSSNEESLNEMCSKARLILSTVGPYTLYGEPLVKACIKNKTHLVDISGEPMYMESMQLKYYDQALEAGIYIISGCGFESLLCDCGINFLREKFKPGEINSIEMYQSVESPAFGTGTWNSCIQIMLCEKEAQNIRSQNYSKFLTKKIPEYKYKLPKTFVIHKCSEINSWIYKFPFNIDKSLIEKSQLFGFQEYDEKPIQYKKNLSSKSLLHALLQFSGFIIFSILVKIPFMSTLFQNYPSIFSMGIFSKKYPSNESLLKQNFIVRLIAKGWKDNESDHPPNKVLVASVKGIDPAYNTTAVLMVQSGVTVLLEADKMPFTGGVLPPGFAFRHTNIIERLEKHGVKFDLDKSKFD